MVASLPLCAALLSNMNKKYLSYVQEGGKAHKHLRFSGEEVVSISTKFAIERSSEDNELVHLRCCHNNKYLVKKSESEGWIIAAAEKPEEDKSLWSCTLFAPIIVEANDGYGQTVVRFQHVQSEVYICLCKEDGALSNCLYLGSLFEDPINLSDVVTIIDWGTLVILPKRVAFKSTNDGKYLMTSSSNQKSSYPCIRSSTSDKEDARVMHEVLINPDGTSCIKSCDADGFWTSHEDGEIVVEPLDTDQKSTENGIFQTFEPIKLSSNTIALRCSQLNKFCLIDSESQELVCNSDSILKETKFTVEDVAISREIYDIEYHLDDARIYDEFKLVLSTSTTINTSQNTLTSESNFKFKDSRSMMWTNEGSLSLGVKVNLKAGGIPFITENGIAIGGGFTGEYEWGETQVEATEKEKSYSVSAPPMTKQILRLVCNRGTCDVPFSYSVREVYIHGEIVVNRKDDGLYTGMNSYNSHTEIENKPIE